MYNNICISTSSCKHLFYLIISKCYSSFMQDSKCNTPTKWLSVTFCVKFHFNTFFMIAKVCYVPATDAWLTYNDVATESLYPRRANNSTNRQGNPSNLSSLQAYSLVLLKTWLNHLVDTGISSLLLLIHYSGCGCTNIRCTWNDSQWWITLFLNITLWRYEL